MGKTEEIRIVFRGLSARGRGALIVGISRRGVHVAEVVDVRASFDQSPPAPYLATTARDACASGSWPGRFR